MKNILKISGYFFIAAGIIFFSLRGTISTISPDESFARDIFNLPLLEPGLHVPMNIYLLSIAGFLVPYVFIGLGLIILKIDQKYRKRVFN